MYRFRVPYGGSFRPPFKTRQDEEAGGAAAVTLDSANKSANLSLSGGDLVATMSGGPAWSMAKANVSKSSGKWYFEVELTTGAAAAYHMIGVANVSMSNATYPGSAVDAVSWGYEAQFGKKYNNGTGTDLGTAATGVGDIIMVAVDLDAGKIWFGVNGTWINGGNPAAGTNQIYSGLSGTLAPAVSPYNTGSIVTSRFASGDFSYALPSGFSAWTGSGATISLTDMDDQRVYQRVAGGTDGYVHISGTYSGVPGPIEARVVQDGTSTEVVGWSEIDHVPSGGAFKGTLKVPVGGWYNVQVRRKNSTAVVSNGSNAWAVGMVVATIGQSNMEYWFTQGTGAPASMTRKKTAAGWATVTGAGAIAFANKLNANLGIPVGLMDYAVSGCGLIHEYSTYDYWLNTAAGAPYPLFSAGMSEVGNRVEALVWVGNETDAFNLETEADVEAALATFFDGIRSDFNLPDIPVFLATPGRDTYVPQRDEDAWQGVRNALYDYAGADSLAFVGSATIDLPISVTVHHTDAGYVTMAERVAQEIMHYLDPATYTYGGRGGQIASFSVVNSTTIDVTLSHNHGSDFTPVTGITGFEVFDDGVAETISAAVRVDATTVRLTISGSLDGVVTARYLYGNDQDISGVLVDNTAMQLPFDDNRNILQV